MRAQTSFEVLIILAALFVLIFAVIIASQEQLGGITASHSINQGRSTTDSLGTAIHEVYSQGEGARKRVFLAIPSGYDASRSSVGNKSVSLHVLGSDMVRTFDFDVVGQLPQTSGSHWVWVISESDQVRIATSLITLSKQALSVVMLQNLTANDSFSIQNVHTGQVNVTITPSWNNSATSMSLSQGSAVLSVGGATSITADFAANQNASGFYTGSIIITATDGSTIENLTLPVTVQVVVITSTSAPPLYIIPAVWNETIAAGDNTSAVFDVCTNPQTSVTGVTFLATSGDAGDWVGSLTALGAIPPDTCALKTFTLFVPNTTLGGNYTGIITGTAVNIPSASDSVGLTIQVIGSVNDSAGPVAGNISKIPKRVFLEEPIWITATCSDLGRGDNNIQNAILQVNNASTYNMNPIDGAFDQPLENVSYQISTVIPFGKHNVTMWCIDNQNNTGPAANYSFVVMKETLFVTRLSNLGTSEANWHNWWPNYISFEGFKGTKTNVQRSDFLNNAVNNPNYNESYYGIVLIADDGITSGSQGSALITRLNTYMANGGVVVFLDEALDDPLDDFGFANGGNDDSLTTIATTNNTHYLTTGYSAPSSIIIYSGSAHDVNYATSYSGSTLMTTTLAQTTRAVLGVGSSHVIWGPSEPGSFNGNGHNVSIRVIDYALLTSTMGES